MLAISAGILSYTTMPLAAESWTYTYNTQGQVLTSDGPRTNISDVTTNTYDSSGNLATSTNALGQVTQSQNYNGRGQPGTIIDPNGIRTELTYSPRGWLLNSTIKDPSNNVALDAVTTFGYDNVGQVISITLADDSVVNYEYDGAQRLVAISNALGERMEYTLDAAGNRTLEVVRDATSIIVKTQARVYDELSRLIQTIGADNQTLSYAYDVNDNIASVTDGKAQVTAVNYDALDRLITETDPDTYNVGYTYDAQDVIQTVIDQRGLVTTYHHNGLGYLTSLVSPDTGTTVYTYDDAGNRTSSIDSRGAVANYSYDALNRLISVSYPNSLTENVTYSYDSTANGNNGIGRLTGITDDSGTLNFTYDHLGNVIAKSYSIGGTAYTSGYTYDLSSNITQIIYSSGRLSSYTRDGQGRVTGITTQENSAAPTETVVSNVTYLPFGPIKSYTYGNGIVHNLNYDQDYRIVDNEALGTSSTLDLNYSYDANNNIATIVDQSNTLNDQRFQYDSIDRIEQADGNYGQLDYQYDGTGNRTQKTQTQGANTTTESYSYGATNNRLDKV
ncbi:hypothetical protein N9913_01260, partial [Porticoccaceae bacterium]|nr:hypothetical protein [Porticoccaceae bacterium]